MNCTDCICSEVCYYKAFNDEKHLKKRREDVEKICKSFVHRDSVKVVQGSWGEPYMVIEEYDIWGRDCSECGATFSTARTNYCPNCGAKMDGGNEDG